MNAIRLASFLAAVTVGPALIALGDHSSANACTINPDYNPLVEADLVVSGYLLGYEVALDATYYEDLYPVDFGMRVDRIFAGEAGDFVTVRSTDPLWNESLQMFTPALCSGLHSSHVGHYVLLALTAGTDGALLVQIPIYIGTGPSDIRFVDMVANLDHPFGPENEAPGPPDVGTGTANPTGAGSKLPVVLVGAGLALAGLAGLTFSRR
jgi:hypothetical protein